KLFPQNPSAKSCASTPGDLIIAEQDGCHEMPLVGEKKEYDFSLGDDRHGHAIERRRLALHSSSARYTQKFGGALKIHAHLSLSPFFSCYFGRSRRCSG